jgi:ABC-type transporter Mla MlaB component
VDSVLHSLPPWNPNVTLKIERSSEEKKTILRVSGRIDPEGVLELKRQLDEVTENVALDLKEVIRVDLEAVRFLGACEVQGIELRNCPPYISEWIRRER